MGTASSYTFYVNVVEVFSNIFCFLVEILVFGYIKFSDEMGPRAHLPTRKWNEIKWKHQIYAKAVGNFMSVRSKHA